MVELERAEATVSGQLAVEGQPAQRFYGWLELIDQLEHAAGQRADNERPRPP